MKTKYIKVSVSERLPEKEGEHLIFNNRFRSFLLSTFEPDDLEKVNYFKENIDFWLEEVLDMEDEMRGMLVKVDEEQSLLGYITSDTHSALDELLTKLKTES